MFNRFTIKNHTVHPSQKSTYRVPIVRIGDFHIKSFGHDAQIQGELIDKLGRYEDLGTPEELKKKLGL